MLSFRSCFDFDVQYLEIFYEMNSEYCTSKILGYAFSVIDVCDQFEK